jgi:hypothetical protein
VVYAAYICAGLAIGRLDLTSRQVAWWLFGGGIVLSIVARLSSAFVLYPLGGLGALISQSPPDGTSDGTVQTLLWEPDSPTSWWYLAPPAPHSHTPVGLVHTLGSAVAVLGAALLLTRLPPWRAYCRPAFRERGSHGVERLRYHVDLGNERPPGTDCMSPVSTTDRAREPKTAAAAHSGVRPDDRAGGRSP